MEWLEEADTQAKAIRDRLRQIVEHEGEIYEALWSELKTHIDAARAKSFPQLFTNGQPLARVIALSQPPTPPSQTGSPKQVKIVLKRDKHLIVATGGGVNVTLEVSVCDDGVVCLTLEDAPVSLKDAAIAILRPFLYPELGDGKPAPRVI
jgi:hypothetical protein